MMIESMSEVLSDPVETLGSDPYLRAPLRIAVGIATRGRALVLRETLARLKTQSEPPYRIVVCGSDASDVAGLEDQPGLQVCLAPPGLCRQRNEILGRIRDCDLILFLDDDFLVSSSYLEAIGAVFEADPAIMVATGHVVADGAVGPGLSLQQGLAALSDDPPMALAGRIEPAWNGYGCNMALRLAPMWRHDLRFDERLPLYGWFEDVDLTRRLGAFGRIVKAPEARGVHLGVKVGRTSGTRLGYSQVANPIYLARKGVYPWARVVRDLSRHILVNSVKSLRPEPFIDRRGRLHGNAMALADLVRRRLRPERVLDL